MMNEQEINVAIAEACGWKHVHYEAPAVNHGNMEWIGIPPSCEKATSSAWMCKIIPNYTCDLNAMHDAENSIRPSTVFTDQAELEEAWKPWESYHKRLCNMVGKDDVAFSTAKERSKCFCLEFKKWVD